MIKNITPKQIAFYSAFVISLASLLLLSAGILLSFISTEWYIAIIFGIASFFFSYFLIIFILKRFIYRKIKLIYKNIHDFKLHSKDKLRAIDLDKDVLEEVEQEVVEWADSQKKEIESLKMLEEYRRNFLGNISHELKTPIFSIQGYVHTLLDGGLYDKDINKNYLRKAAKNVSRLLTIVEDLESISRLESGELILDIQRFDIQILVNEVFEDLELQAKEKNIRLSKKDGTDISFFVAADQENIRQVIINLVSNSIKYGKENGHTKVGCYDMENFILIEIADDGIGISEDHLKHLFDRFYRVDKSRSRSQGGSGLGLSIVKHIIEAHKQTINVRSTEGIGSTFGFTLKKA